MDIYLQEYNADEAVARYTSRTAGSGIGYLLENDYAEVYLSAISDFLRVRSERPLRLLEFGCGGGMNIITLLKLLERRGRSIERAIGADFSQKLILSAQDESRSLLDGRSKKRCILRWRETKPSLPICDGHSMGLPASWRIHFT